MLWIPRPIGYLVSAVVIIPLVTHLISQFQLWTQPLWIILHILPFAAIALESRELFAAWTQFSGTHGGAPGHLDLLMFGTAASVVFSLVAQIGEQVDFLRSLRDRRTSRKTWWIALLSAGPGWIILGALKLLAGSFLAFFALSHNVAAEHAAEPTQMYRGISVCPVSARPGAGADRDLRHPVPAQDQRHQRLRRIDRMVELLLAPDPQSPRTRGLAGIQCRRRRAAHGNRRL